MTINTLLVDDEQHALDTMSILLEEYPQIRIVGSTSDPLKAIELIHEQSIDLLFIDIEMKELNGIETLTKIRTFNSKLIVVFVTAHRNYTEEAIKLNVFNYLLKPIERLELWETIKNITTLFHAPNIKNETFLVNNKGKTSVLKKSDIAQVRAEGSYTHINMLDGSCYIISQNMGKFILRLNTIEYARVNRSCYLRKELITSFNKKLKTCTFKYNDTEHTTSASSVFLKQTNDIL